jgi:ribulose-5-phosphate 4-epimerase/fuculose-1-phosphate aldolase
MAKLTSSTDSTELAQLRELSARIGNNLLLTQASAGNSSIKLDGVLWIKASGKWMADARHEGILIPLNLAEVRKLVMHGIDPPERFTGASIETALHAVLPHRVILHLHSVNTIAWAVRQDASIQLKQQLDGLRWQWISYVPSGLPLASEMERILSADPGTEIFVLGNHGLVIGGDSCDAVEDLLFEVEQRLAISPRPADFIDYTALVEISDRSSFVLPGDDQVHVLATDEIARAVISGGLLYPCQSILANSSTPGMFPSVRHTNPRDQWGGLYDTPPFLIIEGCGVLVSPTITPVQSEMMRGLAQVTQRIGSPSRLRYLSGEEVTNCFSVITSRYRELANAQPCNKVGCVLAEHSS